MFHDLPPILLAVDIVEMVGSLVGVLALVLWVIKQIVEANKQVPPPRPRPAAAPQPQPQPQAGVNPPAQQADPLRTQVEEYLRRAGRGPQGNQPAAQQRRVRSAGTGDVELLVEDDVASERRPLAQPLRPVERDLPSAVPQPGSPQRVPRKLVPPRRQSVAEHVAENIAAHSREVAEQSSRLGQRIIEDDQQFDVQLKAKFDHKVGTLTGSAVAAAEQAEAAATLLARPAAQIAAMLASPEGVRQAIVINEILRRPSERW